VDYYLEWSTVVDAPVTSGMSLAEFKKIYKREYGEKAFREDFDCRMARVNDHETSAFDETLSELISGNRAGDGDELTYKEIIQKYCLGKNND
ncbi:MAG: hypothetical protein AAF810_01280, partial [Cyanobacteria bacterium P01_D01_bin.36]